MTNNRKLRLLAMLFPITLVCACRQHGDSPKPSPKMVQQASNGNGSPNVLGVDGDIELKVNEEYRPATPKRKHGQAPEVRQPSDGEGIEGALAKLRKGNLAYNTPEKMKTGQTAHVIARIGSDKVSINTLESGMPTDKETKTATAPTPVSTNMKMALKSADFDITPLSSEEQLVAGDTPTAWAWDIVPKHSGKLRLHLAAVVELNGLSRDFTTVDRDIAVQVDPVDAAEVFVKANGVWMLTTLGAGLAGLWAWLRKKKKPSWETP